VGVAARGSRLRDLPAAERPRERLLASGAGALSERELLALLIGSGARGRSALTLAQDLLADGLHALAQREPLELAAEHGLGPARAACVAAALELGSRLAAAPRIPAPAFSSPADTAAFLLPRYGRRPLEIFGLLALDARHRLRREVVISTGCLTSSLVHPREVFQQAVLSRAVGLVLFHNHPSGDPEPSADDVALTRRLSAAGAWMGIDVLDHLVLGAGRWVSLKERGVL
jgi:DNA repair protein RadC